MHIERFFICDQVQPAADQSADGNQPNTDKLLEVIIQDYQAPKASDWLSTRESRSQNYIHVSVRKALDDPVDDADYDYTDPSPFLDRLVPIPKWIQECNDHEFRYGRVKYVCIIVKNHHVVHYYHALTFSFLTNKQ